MSATEAMRRARGCLLGLACGDALGRPVEGMSRNAIEREHGRLTEMVGDGVHGRSAGTITDDTHLTLCTARSLATRGGFDGEDVLRRFVEWYADEPVGVGGLTAEAFEAHLDGIPWHRVGQDVWERRPEGQNAGNGSVMRIAPIAIAYDGSERVRGHLSVRGSSLTHADPRCLVGCQLVTAVIADCVAGEPPAVDRLRSLLPSAAPDSLREALTDLDDVDGEELPTSGYVVDTVCTALHDGLSAPSAEEAIARAVNRGGDADTIGAIAGAIAGARFGEDELPDRWLETIDETAELRSLADVLVQQDHNAGERVRDGYTVGDPKPDGPTYVPADPPVEPMGGHRPDIAPYPAIDADARTATPAEAVEADWIRRAYRRTERGRPDRAHRERDALLPPDPTHPGYPQAVRVPEYLSAASVSALPHRDRRRIEIEFDRAASEASAATDAFEAAGSAATAVESVSTTGQLAALVRTGVWGTNVDERRATLEEYPDACLDDLDQLEEAANAATELLSLLDVLAEAEGKEQVMEAREHARDALGHTQAALDALRAVVIRHPELADDAYVVE